MKADGGSKPLVYMVRDRMNGILAGFPLSCPVPIAPDSQDDCNAIEPSLHIEDRNLTYAGFRKLANCEMERL